MPFRPLRVETTRVSIACRTAVCLNIALDFHELACDISREGIRRQRPDAEETEGLLRQRLELGNSIEQASEFTTANGFARLPSEGRWPPKDQPQLYHRGFQAQARASLIYG